MTPYADLTYYNKVYKGEILTASNAEHCLLEASRQINLLTRGRIERIGLENLSSFRIQCVKEATCAQAEFISQNEAMLNTYLSQYSINGVNMQFGQNWNLHTENGVAMPESVYQLLLQTGLLYLGLD